MKPLFLVFEPTNHVYQVIPAAVRRGFDVAVFRTLPLPTAGPYAAFAHHLTHDHPIPSWDDAFDTVLAACKGRDVVGTYAAQELVLELEAQVQEHFGLPGKGSAVIRELLDKVTVRRRLVESGLSRLRVVEEDEVDALRSWPVQDRALFFKPVHGAGSAFVRRCGDLEQVRSAVATWKAADKASLPVLGPYLESGGFFLEEEAPGELLSVEGYLHAGEYHIWGLTSRTVLARDVAVEMGTNYPYPHPRSAEIVEAVTRFHEILGIRYGATHTEVIVPAEGPIELVELNLRFIGADSLSAMNLVYGVAVEDDLVSLAIGEAPRPDLEPRQFACVQFFLAPSGLRRLDSLELPEADLPFVKIIRPPGSELVSTDRQIDWIAAFIVCGPTYDEALRRAIDIRRRTKVNGALFGDDPNNAVLAR